MKKAQLTLILSDGTTRAVDITEDETILGRENCDITIDDLKVSRRHAIIGVHGSAVTIRDLESRNGTYVNGHKITEGVLTSNDHVAIGNTRLVVRTTDRKPHPVDFTEETLKIDATKLKLDGEINEKNLDDLKRATKDLAAIYRSSMKISSLLAPSEFFNAAMDIIMNELPPVDCCSIHVEDEGGKELTCKAMCFRDPESFTDAPAFSKTIIDSVMTDMNAVLIYDAMNDCRFENARSVAGLAIRSSMCVPLRGPKQIIGIIQANTLNPKNRFTRDDLRLLTAIGSQIGTALENSLLYERLEKEKKALRTANDKLTKIQNSLIQSEKLAAVGQLTAGIVHDIKNPMTVIAGHAKIVKSLLEMENITEIDGLNVIESLNEVSSAISHCNDIISNLLQFSKGSPPEKVPSSINSMVKSVLDFLRHELRKKMIAFESDFDPSIPDVQTDANQIKQVLLNIIINAIQAVHEHGKISVITTLIQESEDVVFAAIRVRDDGQGMSEEVRKKIFDPFFTTKEAASGKCGGSGLGLSMSYGIVESHGGRIDVWSEQGKGSEFTILLPAPSEAGQYYATTSTVTDLRKIFRKPVNE
ncbi:MAG: hypothetical protein A2020_14295 [Lentisphaerae bacterium GWF2_45_14]|nr:MAG: hypothetical protein A2020_14295 [Lentisphaerae bacterium GWF2_45_14]